MFLESKLNPQARPGRNSKAPAGLIQITDSDLRKSGITAWNMARLDVIDQLPYIESYLQPHTGRFSTLVDTWLACYFPDGLGRGGRFYFRLPEKYYYARRIFKTENNNRTWTERVDRNLRDYFISLGWNGDQPTSEHP